MNPIYFDHAATTPLDDRVLEAMMPHLMSEYGNPSSVHRFGRKARFIIEECRERIADMIGAAPGEVIFTSGGTESDNLAIHGIATEGALVTSAGEHEAVLRAVEHEASTGRRSIILKPTSAGAVTVGQVEEALDEPAALVSIMHANNEVGTLSPIRDIGAVCRSRPIPFHTDAVQTIGTMNLDVDDLQVDMLSASSHKFYGPKGAGFLYVRSGIDLKSLIRGGAQERGRRGGTENVASIVGMTEALHLARNERKERTEHLTSVRSALLHSLEAVMGGEYQLNTPESIDQAVPGIVNISFPPRNGRAIDGEMLLLNLDMEGIMVSAGSACTSGALEPSHVLRAMEVPEDTAVASVRFSFGNSNTTEEVTRAADILARTITRMRRAAA